MWIVSTGQSVRRLGRSSLCITLRNFVIVAFLIKYTLSCSNHLCSCTRVRYEWPMWKKCTHQQTISIEQKVTFPVTFSKNEQPFARRDPPMKFWNQCKGPGRKESGPFCCVKFCHWRNLLSIYCNRSCLFHLYFFDSGFHVILCTHRSEWSARFSFFSKLPYICKKRDAYFFFLTTWVSILKKFPHELL